MTIDIVIGPMFSGKSTELQRCYKRYKSKNIPLLIVNHVIDTRYDQSKINSVCTHNNNIIKNNEVVKVSCLMPLLESETYKNSKIVLIDEGQFFDDLLEFTKQVEMDGKDMMICGLDCDFERNPFGQILQCIPFADTVKKLSAYCFLCPNLEHAAFTKRIDQNNSNQILIGSKEKYLAVCHKHFQ